MDVSLVEIDADNLRSVMDLKVKPDQDNYVAPNSVSIAQKCYDDESWMRAIFAGDEPVGFVLLSERRSVPRYYLWRYMIDGDQQGKGYGTAGMNLLVEYVRTLPGATELFLSFVPGEHGPQAFYQGYGFVATGREQDGELEMRLEL